MTTAVLVHGGWHSASCWDLVRAELTADGIRSVAPQLPMTSTLDVDAAVVRETLDSLDDDAVVVAHSWGGSPVTLGASGAPNVRHLIYLAAFAFYGLTTVAIGARARDNADAQNLARPMFGVLLAVFFTALALAGGGAHNLAWLVFIPPFTPFVLLTQPQGPGVEFAALSVLAAATAAAAWAAVRAVTLDAKTSSNRRIRPVQIKV